MHPARFSRPQQGLGASTHTPLGTQEPPCSLFVGDLSSICREQDLRALFLSAGFEPMAVHMMGWKASASSFDYAFVQLRTRTEAAAALQSLRGAIVGGRPIRIGWAQSHTKATKASSTNSVHIRYRTLRVSVALLLLLAPKV